MHSRVVIVLFITKHFALRSTLLCVARFSTDGNLDRMQDERDLKQEKKGNHKKNKNNNNDKPKKANQNANNPDEKRVTVCHKRGPHEWREIQVPEHKVERHKKHGDHIGPCKQKMRVKKPVNNTKTP